MKLGKGEYVSVMAIGLVELCFNNKTSCLSDCLFVPDFKRNLVYVSCLVEHGLTVQFNSSVSIKSNNAFICSGLLINGLYFLTPMSYSINAIENTDDEQFPLSKKMKFSNETYMWHLRLGHIDSSRIHGLVQSGILNSLIFEPIPVCESCLEGKMSRPRFPVRPDWRIRTGFGCETMYWDFFFFSLKLNLYLWYTNNFCNNQLSFTYTKELPPEWYPL